MALRFTHGDAAQPRGHAVVIARSATGRGAVYATYCVALPIRFSLDQFIAPIISQHLPIDARQIGDSIRFMPLPPFLEAVEDLETLLALADYRGDDVVEIEESGDLGNIGYRTQLAAMVCQEYGEMYARNERDIARRPPARRELRSPATPAPAVETTDLPHMLAESTPATDLTHLSEVARLIGTLRYAVEGQDQRQIDEAKRALLRASAPLDEKYRVADLLKAALVQGATGQQLANLYLTRAYKLAEEDYAAIPPLEQQIKDLEA